MGAQDDTEKVLRNIHIILSKSEAYPEDKSKVIVDKQKMINELTALNKCIYALMEEYEITKSSKEQARRDFQKQGDEIILDASKKAEDVYAASVMYTDEALRHVQDIMNDATESMRSIFKEMDEKLKNESRTVRTNQSELKSQLRNLVDTEKYLKLIEESNRQLKKEKERNEGIVDEDKLIYANRQTGIKINAEYFEKMGIQIDEDGKAVEIPHYDDLDALQDELNEAKENSDKSPIEKSTFKNKTSAMSSYDGILGIDEGDHERVSDEVNYKAVAAESEVKVDTNSNYFKWKAKQEAKNSKAANNTKAVNNDEVNNAKAEIDEANFKKLEDNFSNTVEEMEKKSLEELRADGELSRDAAWELADKKGELGLDLSESQTELAENIKVMLKNIRGR